MMICGMMVCSGQIELAALRDVIDKRMLCYARFRQRVIQTDHGPQWEDDPRFDLDWHVRRIALPAGDAASLLAEVTSDLISTPLDRTKPMWQFHLIESVDGGSALVLRIHHCYGDGFALMHVVMSMTDADPAHPQGAEEVAMPQSARSAWERIFGPLTETVGDALRTSIAAVELGRSLVAHPSAAIDYVREGAGFAREAAFIANMAPDSVTRFKGPLGVMKRTAWGKPLALSEVKALAQAVGCTVNDVAISCATGALRSYLLQHGDQLVDVEIRALVPVNLRPAGPLRQFGNYFGLVFLDLPLNIDDPLTRILEVHERMKALKHSQQPLVALGILAGMGIAPDYIKEKLLEALAANASVVMTNVHGPDEPRYIAGKRILRQMFWVPQSGGIGVGLSLLSYAGEVNFGVATDARRVPDPQAVADGFAEEFEAALLSLLMMPWPAGAEPVPDTHVSRRRKKPIVRPPDKPPESATP